MQGYRLPPMITYPMPIAVFQLMTVLIVWVAIVLYSQMLQNQRVVTYGISGIM